MKTDDQNETGVLRLSVCEGTKVSQLRAAAVLIRGLPGVLRVGANLAAGQLEILFLDPTVGLLREVHAVLRIVNTDMAASKVY